MLLKLFYITCDYLWKKKGQSVRATVKEINDVAQNKCYSTFKAWNMNTFLTEHGIYHNMAV